MPRRLPAQRSQPPSHEVLLVGPNRARISRLNYALKRYGFDVKPVVYGASPASLKGVRGVPRVIVADVPPPVTAKHVHLVNHLRERWEWVPIIAVTESDNPSVLTSFLALGVDDFSPHASRPAELVVRIRWQFARPRRGPAENSNDHSGTSVMRHTLAAHGRAVPLTARELALYSCLAARLGQVVSRDEIGRAVWGGHPKSKPPDGGMEVYVYYLRQKLAKLGLKKALRTVRGVGYVLVEEALVS